jgi:hypothetical protein
MKDVKNVFFSKTKLADNNNRILQYIIKYTLKYSYILFFINSMVAYLYKYYIYSISFLFLIFTSYLYRQNKNIYTDLLDKFAIFLVVFCGGYLFYNKVYNIFYDNGIDINDGENSVSKRILSYISKIRWISLYLIYFILVSFLLTIFIYYIENTKEFQKYTYSFHSYLHFISFVGHLFICIL